MAKRKSATGVPEAPTPSSELAQWFSTLAHETIFQYQGDLAKLEAALGFMFVGHYYGWKVLYLIHTKRTVREYEQILGISIREQFSEVGPYADRNSGWLLVKSASNFWKVVSGEVKVEGAKKDAL